MKILVLCNNIFVVTHLVDRFSECDDVFLDVITPPINYQPISPNVNIIRYDMIMDSDKSVAFPPLNAMAKYALENHSQYDLILTFSNWLQTNPDFMIVMQKVPVLCPDASCAFLEGDKDKTKQLLQSLNIPTPKSKILNRDEIISTLDQIDLPIVLKSSKSNYRVVSFGTNVFHNRFYKETITELLQKSDDDQVFYVEDFIDGPELSMHFLCNGNDWCYLGEARDYKKLHENDIGINTDGIGCYSPGICSDDIKTKVGEYLTKLLSAIPYKGIIYLGVIIKDDIPYILEINTRPGSPEFASIVNRHDPKLLLENFVRAAKCEPFIPMKQNDITTVVVMVHHKHYSFKNFANTSSYPKFADVPSDIKIVYGEPSYFRDNLYCIVMATGNTLAEASDKIYRWIDTQDLQDYTVRRDIGYYV